MFDKKVCYKVKKHNSLRIAPKKIELFDWIEIKYKNIKQVDKLEKVFIYLSNIILNLKTTEEFVFLCNDMQKYLNSEMVNNLELSCTEKSAAKKTAAVGKKACIEEIIFKTGGFKLSKNIMMIFCSAVVHFYKLPNDTIDKCLKKFGTYLKLRYNIRQFDIDMQDGQ